MWLQPKTLKELQDSIIRSIRYYICCEVDRKIESDKATNDAQYRETGFSIAKLEEKIESVLQRVIVTQNQLPRLLGLTDDVKRIQAKLWEVTRLTGVVNELLESNAKLAKRVNYLEQVRRKSRK